MASAADDLTPLKRTLGDLLAAHRAAADLTQQELADAIGYARVTVATAESGHRQPAAAFWDRCDDQLGAEGELRRAYAELATGRDRRRKKATAQDQARRIARARPPHDHSGSHLAPVGTAADRDRAPERYRDAPGEGHGREVGELAAVHGRWELSGRRRFRPTRKLIEEDVDPITRRYRSLYHLLPSADLLPAVLGHLRLVDGLLAGADDGTRRALGSTAAETAGFAAWLCGDLGDGVRMLRLYGTAEHAVAESGDRALGGYIRGFQAQMLVGRGDYLRGVQEAQAARDQVGRSASAVVLAWLVAVHAKALACAGRPVEARQALTEAERQLDRGPAARRPEWMYDFDRPRFVASAGACYLRMARPVEAERVLREALSTVSPTGGRRRAEVGVDLAHALLQVGQADEAIALAGAAADTFGAWDSASGLDRVTAFARSLQRTGNALAARSLTERVLAYTATP